MIYLLLMYVVWLFSFFSFLEIVIQKVLWSIRGSYSAIWSIPLKFLNDILTNRDFSTDQTFHQFYELNTDLDLQRIISGFHGAFATAVECQQGTLTLPDTWFRPSFLGFSSAKIAETRFLELAMSLLDFSPWIPLDIFSIVLLVEKGNKTVNQINDIAPHIMDCYREQLTSHKGMP